MIKNLLTATALLVSFSILCLGHGLQSVLLPARGAMFEHYPNMTTGAMMSVYYIGFIIGTFICPLLIGRVGHIRVFAASAACASTIMLCHALLPDPFIWIGLRAIYGFCMVHLYTVMESWLNSIGDLKSRGKILSVYMIINFLAMSSGQLLFFVAPVNGFELFSISAIMLSLSIVPLMVSSSVQPSIIKTPEFFGIKQLFKISPLGVVGAMTAGLMAGAYWGLTSVFILRMGYAQEAIAWFMSASLVGGLLVQWPLGVISDRINRRYVIILAATLVFIPSVILSLMALWDSPSELFGIWWLVAIGAFFGAGFHPLYSLCIAHANDFIEPEHLVRASSGLQFVQGMGAIVGPLIAGVLMYLGGYAMLFLYIGALAALFILYTLQRMAEGRKPAEGMSMPFRLLTRMGIITFFADPRYRN
ncbi:MAG: MFS transporter [Pseudomonadota bacterium]